MAVVLSLIRSVAPSKLVMDSEWHLVTDCCTSARERFASPSYSTVRAWFNALHGMGAMVGWYYGRSADGLASGPKSPNKLRASQFLESIGTQPIAMDGLHRGIQQLQSSADVVARLASARRSVHVLFSQRSYHAGGMHGRAIYTAVEALTFLGTPWGFLPADGDGEESGGLAAKLRSLPADDVLILAGVSHVEPPAAAAVEEWVATRGTARLLIIDEGSEPMAFDATSGYHHPSADRQRRVSALSGVRHVGLLAAEEMLTLFEDTLLPTEPASRAVSCYETEGSRAGRPTTLGVMCMAGARPGERLDRGPYRHVAVVNLRASTARVSMSLALPGGGAPRPGERLRDLVEIGHVYTADANGRVDLLLAPAQVLLLEISTCATCLTHSAWCPGCEDHEVRGGGER